MFTKIVKAAEKLYFLNEFSLNKSNLKKTWDLIKISLNKNNSFCKIILKDDDDNLITDSKIISNKLNEHFSSVATINDTRHSNTDFKSFLGPSVPDSFFLIDTHESEILRIVECLKNSKSEGVDCISNFLLKKIIYFILTPLNHLINLSFKFGQFPRCYKTSKIVPLFKSGCKHTVSNYRPISLIPSISKVIEKLIFIRLTNFLDKHAILSDFQYGFRQFLSTELAILDLVQYINSNIEAKLFTIGIFIDLQKAFDSLDHRILIMKLENYGIRGIALQWFSSYLSERDHFVSIESTSSDLQPMKSGVPQGSILGPLLFNIFLNDLVKASAISRYVLYADDTTVLLHDSCIDRLMKNADIEINKINYWLLCNNLKLNLKKTCYIIFGPKISTNLCKTFLTIDNIIIDRVDSTKYLGIIISSNLSWFEHITYITKKISKNIGIISKLKHKFTSNIIKTLYYSLIFPYITYCVSIWGNSPKYHLALITKCQNYYIRVLFNLSKYNHITSYYKSANILNILQIFKFNVLKLFFKLFICNTCAHLRNLIIFHIYIPSRSFRNIPSFRIPKIRTELLSHSPLITGMKLWNSLPSNITNCNNFNGFKKMLFNLISTDHLSS